MKYRNSVSYSNKDGKSNTNQNNIYKEKALKNYFLSNLKRMSLKNNDLIKNLSNTFRNYELNINKKDEKISDNLYNISVNNVFNIKTKLKKAYKLYQKYDEQFSFNPKRDLGKSSIDKNTYNKINDKENSKINLSLNINNIAKNNNSGRSKDLLYKINKDEKPINDNKNLNIKKLFYQNGEIKKLKRYSLNINKENILKSNTKFIISEENMRTKIRKAERLDKLLNVIDDIKRKEKINENKYFKFNKENTQFRSFYRKISKEKKFDYDLIRKKYKLKNGYIDNCLSEEKTIFIKNITNNFPERNIKILKKNLTSTEFKPNDNNLSVEKKEKQLNCSNIKNISRNNLYCKYSSSFPNLKINKIKMKNSKGNPLLNLSPINKKKIKFSLTSHKKNNNINPIIHKTINEGKKINKIIKRNYLMHKEPIITKNFSDILDEEKLDLKSIRKNLRLKYSKGIFGEINEIQILYNNIKKMKQYITPKEISFIKYIAKGMIKEDLFLNKNLVYNVGLEHRDNRKKYLELYNILTNSKFGKKIRDKRKSP